MAKRSAKKTGEALAAAESDSVGSAAAPSERLECRTCGNKYSKVMDDIWKGQCSSCHHISHELEYLENRIAEFKDVPDFVLQVRASKAAADFNKPRDTSKGDWFANPYVCKKCKKPYIEMFKANASGSSLEPLLWYDFNPFYCSQCRSLRNCIAQAKARKFKFEERKRFQAEELARLEREAAARKFQYAAQIAADDDIPF